MKDGFISVACGAPKLRLADCAYNAEQSFQMMRSAEKAGARVLVLPELGLTGYTCGDLFHQDALLREAEEALNTVLAATRNLEVVTALGMPLRVHNELYNCAVIIQKGKILGVVPKTHLPNYGEFYEKRWFAPAPPEPESLPLLGREFVTFGAGQVFRCENVPGLALGFEICEDLWSPDSPSLQMAKDGAVIIGNLSASNDLVGKDAYRRQLVTMQSAKLLCGYVYASAGAGESSADLVFGAHQLIAEDGTLLAERRFEGGLLVSEIDIQRLACERRRTQALGAGSGNGGCEETFTLTEGITKLTGLPGPQAAAGAHRGEDRRGGPLRRAGFHAGGADHGPCHEAAGPAPDRHHRRHHALLRHHGPDEKQRRHPGRAHGGHPPHGAHRRDGEKPLPGHRPRPGGPFRHL